MADVPAFSSRLRQNFDWLRMMDFQQGANLVFLLIPVHKQAGSCYFHREGMFGGRGIHIFIDEYDADYDDGGDDASQGSDEKPISVIIE